jgi:hypothetical protein
MLHAIYIWALDHEYEIIKSLVVAVFWDVTLCTVSNVPAFQRIMLPPFSPSLMMKAARSTETSVGVYRTKRRNILVDSSLHAPCRVNT